MSQDHYAVLGVGPNSDERQIRSAYLELIRRCHPDASPSPEAGQKARAINQAYVVLRDREKRAHYDRVRGYGLPAQLLHDDLVREPPRRRRLEPLLFVSVAGAAALGLWQLTTQLERSVPRAALTSAATPDSSAAYETTNLSATGEESFGGFDPLPPDIELDVLAKSEVVAVAQAAPMELAQGYDPPRSLPLTITSKPSRRVTDAIAPVPQLSAEVLPSQGQGRQRAKPTCDELPSRAEAESCRTLKFAMMDRQLGALFAEAIAKTDDERRTRLFESGHRFISRLSSCASDDCVRRAYVARSREVASIAFASDGGQGK